MKCKSHFIDAIKTYLEYFMHHNVCSIFFLLTSCTSTCVFSPGHETEKWLTWKADFMNLNLKTQRFRRRLWSFNCSWSVQTFQNHTSLSKPDKFFKTWQIFQSLTSFLKPDKFVKPDKPFKTWQAWQGFQSLTSF